MLQLPERDYPFIDRRLPLAELAMIEVPPDLERLIRAQSEQRGVSLLRDVPFELRLQSEEYPEATFLVWWPSGGTMHLLAPRRFRSGEA